MKNTKCNVRAYPIQTTVEKTISSPVHSLHDLKEKWQLDEDKLTFIILASALDEQFPMGLGLSPTDKRLADLQMIGDVNIFMNGAIPSHPSAQVYLSSTPSLPSTNPSAGGTESKFQWR